MSGWALRKVLSGHKKPIVYISKMDDKHFVSASWDRTLKIWNSKGELIATFFGHQKALNTVIVLSNGMIVSGSDDETLKFWNPQTGSCFKTIHVGAEVWSLLELNDGRIACGCSDGKVYIYRDFQLQKKLTGHNEFVTTITQQKNGFLVSASDSLIRIYDENEECIRVLKEKGFTANSLCSLKRGGFASSSHGDSIKLWSETGDCLDCISCHAVIYSIVELHDGTIASCSSKKLIFVEKNGCIIQELSCASSDSMSLLELQDGLLVSGACDDKIRIWRNNAMRLCRMVMVDVQFEFVD